MYKLKETIKGNNASRKMNIASYNGTIIRSTGETKRPWMTLQDGFLIHVSVERLIIENVEQIDPVIIEKNYTPTLKRFWYE